MSNPYESPTATSGPWPPRLTRGQRKTLAFALGHRGRRLRWRDVLRFVAPTWGVFVLLMLVAIVGGAIVLAFDYQFASILVLIFIGMSLGWFAIQLTLLSQLVQVWPLIDRAVDWEQVEQALTRS